MELWLVWKTIRWEWKRGREISQEAIETILLNINEYLIIVIMGAKGSGREGEKLKIYKVLSTIKGIQKDDQIIVIWGSGIRVAF